MAKKNGGKLKQVYDLYKSKGLINTTDYETFASASPEQQQKLYELGAKNGLFKTTTVDQFSSAFSPSQPVNQQQKKSPVRNVQQGVSSAFQSLPSATSSPSSQSSAPQIADGSTQADFDAMKLTGAVPQTPESENMFLQDNQQQQIDPAFEKMQEQTQISQDVTQIPEAQVAQQEKQFDSRVEKVGKNRFSGKDVYTHSIKSPEGDTEELSSMDAIDLQRSGRIQDVKVPDALKVSIFGNIEHGRPDFIRTEDGAEDQNGVSFKAYDQNDPEYYANVLEAYNQVMPDEYKTSPLNEWKKFGDDAMEKHFSEQRREVLQKQPWFTSAMSKGLNDYFAQRQIEGGKNEDVVLLSLASSTENGALNRDQFTQSMMSYGMDQGDIINELEKIFPNDAPSITDIEGEDDYTEQYYKKWMDKLSYDGEGVAYLPETLAKKDFSKVYRKIVDGASSKQRDLAYQSINSKYDRLIDESKDATVMAELEKQRQAELAQASQFYNGVYRENMYMNISGGSSFDKFEKLNDKQKDMYVKMKNFEDALNPYNADNISDEQVSKAQKQRKEDLNYSEAVKTLGIDNPTMLDQVRQIEKAETKSLIEREERQEMYKSMAERVHNGTGSFSDYFDYYFSYPVGGTVAKNLADVVKIPSMLIGSSEEKHYTDPESADGWDLLAEGFVGFVDNALRTESKADFDIARGDFLESYQDGDVWKGSSQLTSETMGVLTDMLLTVIGAGAISKGMRKGLSKQSAKSQVDEVMKSKNLGNGSYFASSMSMNLNDYYESGIQNGLNKDQALYYAIMGAGMMSMVEAVNPSMETGLVVNKTAAARSTQALAKDLAEGMTFKQAARKNLSMLGKNVFGENAEEYVQAFTDVMNEAMFNEIYDANFEATLTKEDLLRSTIMTVPISGAASARQLKSRSSYYKEALYGATQDMNEYKRAVEGLVDDGAIDEAQAKDMWKEAQEYRKAVDNIPADTPPEKRAQQAFETYISKKQEDAVDKKLGKEEDRGYETQAEKEVKETKQKINDLRSQATIQRDDSEKTEYFVLDQNGDKRFYSEQEVVDMSKEGAEVPSNLVLRNPTPEVTQAVQGGKVDEDTGQMEIPFEEKPQGYNEAKGTVKEGEDIPERENKTEEDAIQKQQAEEVPVREQAEGSQEVRESQQEEIEQETDQKEEVETPKQQSDETLRKQQDVEGEQTQLQESSEPIQDGERETDQDLDDREAQTRTPDGRVEAKAGDQIEYKIGEETNQAEVVSDEGDQLLVKGMESDSEFLIDKTDVVQAEPIKTERTFVQSKEESNTRKQISDNTQDAETKLREELDKVEDTDTASTVDRVKDIASKMLQGGKKVANFPQKLYNSVSKYLSETGKEQLEAPIKEYADAVYNSMMTTDRDAEGNVVDNERKKIDERLKKHADRFINSGVPVTEADDPDAYQEMRDYIAKNSRKRYEGHDEVRDNAKKILEDNSKDDVYNMVVGDYPMAESLRNYLSAALVDHYDAIIKNSSEYPKTTVDKATRLTADLVIRAAQRNEAAGQAVSVNKAIIKDFPMFSYKVIEKDAVRGIEDKLEKQGTSVKDIEKDVADFQDWMKSQLDENFDKLLEDDKFRKAVENIVGEQQKKQEARKAQGRQKKVSKDQLESADQLIKKGLAKLKESRKNLGANFNAELLEAVGYLAAGYIKKGFYKTKDVIDNVLLDLKDSGIEIEDEQSARDRINEHLVETNKDYTKVARDEAVDVLKSKKMLFQNKIKELVNAHYSEKNKQYKELSKALVSELNLPESAAKKIEAQVKYWFHKEVSEQAKKELNRRYKNYKVTKGGKTELRKSKKSTRKKSVTEKMIDDLNAGVLDNHEMRSKFFARHGIIDTGASSDFRIKMEQYQRRLVEAPGKREKLKVQGELASYIKEVQKKYNLFGLAMSMYYNGLLSGMTTHGKNWLYNIGTNMGLYALQYLKNPRMSFAFRNYRTGSKGGKRRFIKKSLSNPFSWQNINYAFNILRTGDVTDLYEGAVAKDDIDNLKWKSLRKDGLKAIPKNAGTFLAKYPQIFGKRMLVASDVFFTVPMQTKITERFLYKKIKAENREKVKDGIAKKMSSKEIVDKVYETLGYKIEEDANGKTNWDKAMEQAHNELEGYYNSEIFTDDKKRKYYQTDVVMRAHEIMYEKYADQKAIERDWTDQWSGQTAKEVGKEIAKMEALQGDPIGTIGLVTGMMNRALQYVPIVKYSIPLVNIVGNMMNTAITAVPLIGAARAGLRYSNRSKSALGYYIGKYSESEKLRKSHFGSQFLEGKQSKERATRELEKVAVSHAFWALGYLLTNAIGYEDDEGEWHPYFEITGRLDPEWYNREYLQTRDEREPYTVYFMGKKLFTYKDMPLGFALAPIGTFNDIKQVRDNPDVSSGQVVEEIAYSLLIGSTMITDKGVGTFMEQLTEMAEVFVPQSEQDIEKGFGERWAMDVFSKINRIYAPGVLRSIEDAQTMWLGDGYQRRKTTIFDALAEGIPFLEDSMLGIAYDELGRPKKEISGFPFTEQQPVEREDVDEVYQNIGSEPPTLRYNNRLKYQDMYGQKFEYYDNDKKEMVNYEVKLNKREYHVYRTLYGKNIRKSFIDADKWVKEHGINVVEGRVSDNPEVKRVYSLVEASKIDPIAVQDIMDDIEKDANKTAQKEFFQFYFMHEGEEPEMRKKIGYDKYKEGYNSIKEKYGDPTMLDLTDDKKDLIDFMKSKYDLFN